MPSQVVTQWLVRPGGLAHRLRSLRVTAGLSGVALADKLDWSKHKLSKIERGKQLLSADEIRAWVDACDGSEAAAGELVRLLTESRSIRLDWDDRLTGGQGGVQPTYLELITAATDLAFVEVNLIPGPLQVPGYAEQVLAWSEERHGKNASTLEEAVANRLAGGQFLYDQSKQFTIVISEAALRYQYVVAEVMLAQLDRLQTVIGLQNVWFGIIPLDARLVGMVPAAFTIYDNLVLVETYGEEHPYKSVRKLDQYWQAVKQAQELAVTGDKARALILAAAERHRQGQQ